MGSIRSSRVAVWFLASCLLVAPGLARGGSSLAPSITSVSPTPVSVEGGEEVVVTGASFALDMRVTLGDAVVDHYTNYADVELAAFNATVTDWERFRGFERM